MDPTQNLYAISAWNDNGKPSLVHDPGMYALFCLSDDPDERASERKNLY